LNGIPIDAKPSITEGFCLRSFTEVFISKDEIKEVYGINQL
jgi:hypothetical protein